MIARSILIVSFALGLIGCSDSSSPDGFAGLADTTESGTNVPFLQPGPGDRLTFPNDWGPHPQHQIEWWYLTANLETESGQPVGLQWTQFRQALTPRAIGAPPPDAEQWPMESAWMAHAAISHDQQHYFSEKLARGDIGHAGALAHPFSVWLDDWQLAGPSGQGPWQLQVSADDWSYELSIRVKGEPVAHGDQGFSAKSASGEGSMYFSLVNLEIEGTVTIGDQSMAVSGKGWFDREWSSQFLKAGQQGWDWFALHLESGDKLMLFRLREEKSIFRSGTWIPSEGSPVALTPNQLNITPVLSGPGYPRQWRVELPDFSVDLDISAPKGSYINDGLYQYWESPVTVSGSHKGVGYMELTGYGAGQP